MKTIKIKKAVVSAVAILMMAITAFPVYVKADNSSSSNGKAVLVTKSSNPLKKRMPSRTVLVVQYSDGLLSLSSDYCEGEFAITFDSCETSESYEIPTMTVGESTIFYLPNGEYNVTAVDSEGRTFSGCLILQ